MKRLQRGVLLVIGDEMKNKKNLLIAFVFHILIVIPILFFASHEGILGKKMKELSVMLIPKPKIEEIQKTVTPPSPVIPPLDIPKPVSQPTIPQIVSPSIPSAAPAAVALPAFDFSDGAKAVRTLNDPTQIYKSYVEHYVKTLWIVPDNIAGIVEMEVIIDKNGQITSTKMVAKNDDLWAASVLDVFKKVKNFPKVPPQGFPLTFNIRFDTQNE